ncbi:MAG TPA: dockerin type I domain-containing protein, partial [Pirellulales bacterium]
MSRLAHLSIVTAAIVLLGTLAAPAHAVVLTVSNDAINAVAPGNDPGWNNVARMSGGSAVYLGNRWMITANHVSDAPVRFSDGRVFSISPSSDVPLATPGSPTPFLSADLRMFRLTADPGLPSLSIAQSSPQTLGEVMMIGAGLDRAADLIGWSVTAQNQWTPVPLVSANAQGFGLLGTSHMRWGINQVAGESPVYQISTNTIVFNTRYDKFGVPYEAQAAVGDSGGGVFQFADNAWKLVGIMDTVSPVVPNQPSGTVVFGDETQSADLASYRSQIEGLLTRVDPPWQNSFNRYDVDGSGRVTARDVLLMVKELRVGPLSGQLPGTHGATDLFFDVNGDGSLSVSDASALISAILQHKASPAVLASPSSALFVPEPSSGLLALLAAIACGRIVV